MNATTRQSIPVVRDLAEGAADAELEAPTTAALAVRDPILSLASFVRTLGVSYVTIQTGFSRASFACDSREAVRALYATLVKHGATPKTLLSEVDDGQRSWLQGDMRIGDLDLNIYGGFQPLAGAAS